MPLLFTYSIASDCVVEHFNP